MYCITSYFRSWLGHVCCVCPDICVLQHDYSLYIVLFICIVC